MDQPIENPFDDVLARQYNKWPYPKPTRDLIEYERTGRDIADPSIHHRVYWPDREYPDGMEILIAGCGANQGADIAYHNPKARILGIDVSENSLANERYLREKHNLKNLELLRLPIEEVQTLGREFDLIISTGVLHHMQDPQQGMNVLAPLLRRDGVASIWLYGRYGRIGLEMMQQLFLKTIGMVPSDESIAIARETLKILPVDHPMKVMEPKCVDLDFDGGIVDELLGAREVSYTVEDCLDYIAKSGLVFQGWVENRWYYPEAVMGTDTQLYKKIAALPERKIWSATDLFICNPGHHFLACRPDRPKEQYEITFEGQRYLDYVPLRRMGTTIVQPDRIAGTPARLKRETLEVPITDLQAALLNHVDGKRNIRAIAEAAGRSGLQGEPARLQEFARTVFQSLWRLGLIVIRLARA